MPKDYGLCQSVGAPLLQPSAEPGEQLALGGRSWGCHTLAVGRGGAVSALLPACKTSSGICWVTQQNQQLQASRLINAMQCLQVHLLQPSQDLLVRGPPANSFASPWSGALDRLLVCSHWARLLVSAQLGPRLQGPAASCHTLLLAS